MTEENTIAERLWSAERRFGLFEEKLDELVGEFDRLGHDYYDGSLEIRGARDDLRLGAEAQKLIKDAGFSKVYVNHKDGWETHYTFGDGPLPVRGWRRRYVKDHEAKTDRTIAGDPDPGYFEISYWPEGWNSPGTKDWLATGYMRIVPDPLEERDDQA